MPFNRLLLLALLLVAAGCNKEISELRFRPYHDPFDTSSRAWSTREVPARQRQEFQEAVRKSTPVPRPADGARYSPGFPPVGTAYFTLAGDSSDHSCECWEDRVICRGEPELRFSKTALPAFRKILHAIDSTAKAEDSAERSNPRRE